MTCFIIKYPTISWPHRCITYHPLNPLPEFFKINGIENTSHLESGCSLHRSMTWMEAKSSWVPLWWSAEIKKKQVPSMDQTSTHKKWLILGKQNKTSIQIVEQINSFKIIYKKLELNAWLLIYHSETEKKDGLWENQDGSCGMVSLYYYTMFCSNHFRNSMQT